MSRPRVFRVPGLQVRGMNPGSTPPAMVNAPVKVRQHFGPGLAGYANNMPTGSGTPGNPLWMYSENVQYDPPGGGPGQQSLQIPPMVGEIPPAPSARQRSMPSTPYGQSEREWINPTTYSTIPINASINPNAPALTLNYKRNSLIIQNTSTATAVGDTAPTLYIGFNAQPQELGSLALPPGLGFYWSASDCPPRDTIFVLFGTFVNVGISVVISGCIVQGTYVPNG